MNSIVGIATRGPRGRRSCIENSTLEPQDSRSAPAVNARRNRIVEAFPPVGQECIGCVRKCSCSSSSRASGGEVRRGRHPPSESISCSAVPTSLSFRTVAYFYPKDILRTSWEYPGNLFRTCVSWRMRLCSARDSYTYVPHLIAAGLGTGFEERRDNETRSNSLDRLLHRSLSLGQCCGEQLVATGTEGRPKGQGPRKTRLTVLLERVSSGYDLRELKSSSRNPRFTLAGSHAAGNCVVK
ncbi:hypothetical protein G5I_04556 [Acromyrmex echinatior]|uniref:Uncharacterized protein n=1 Tax=Acromyrmex echinatior TaxID=103372 RepID=F4WFY5_ACREC|nr:hypothetical protein G5I_04556 [Acromyrmex echinatior]